MDFENPEVESIENNSQEPEIQTEHTPEGEGAEETPQYSPDFKFRVGESEHEFDERIKASGLIKTKEDEEYFRDLYTKAYGLDVVKKRHEEKEQKWQSKESEFSSLRSQYDRVQNTIQKLNTLKGEDFGVFQKAWEIPDQVVLQRASEILQIHGDPQAQARADKAFQDRLQAMQYEDRVNQESQQNFAVQRQLHEMKLEHALMSPDISKFAAEYDKRMGPGAFREEVNLIGTIDHSAGRGYTDPKDAVIRAHQKLAKLIGPLETPASTSPAASSQQKAPQRPALPNLGSGRTGTPVSKKPRSIADLKKLAEQLEK